MQRTAIFARKVASISKFSGSSVVKYLALGVAAGLMLFCVEIALAFGLQAFLLVLGVANEESLSFPAWVPRHELKAVLLYLFGAIVARGLFQWAQYYLQEAAHENFMFLQRNRLLNWVFHSRSASAAKMSTLFGERTSQAGIAVMYFQGGILWGTSGVTLGAALVWFYPQMAIPGILLFLILAPLLRVLTKRMSRLGRGLADEWERTNSRLMMGIRNLLLLSIYGTRDSEEKKAQQNLKTYLTHSMSHKFLGGFIFSSPQFFGVVLICVLVLYAKNSQMVAPGALISFFYLFIRFVQIISQLAFSGSNFLFYLPQLRELYRFSNQTDEVSELFPTFSTTHSSHTPDGPFAWKFNKVKYHYPKTKKSTLDGVTLEVKPGSLFVITGASGVGKSTLLNIMLGQIEPSQGEVFVSVGGKKVTDIHAEVLPHIGYVGPESYIIEGSIQKNLRYGLSYDFSQEEIDQAVEKAECGFIHDLPGGFDHELTEQGQGLSAGQKQRLSLVRALLRKPKALILDEATSNLDFDTEKRLVKTLVQLRGQMTIVAVTHREELKHYADHVFRLT